MFLKICAVHTVCALVYECFFQLTDKLGHYDLSLNKSAGAAAHAVKPEIMLSVHEIRRNPWKR